MSVILSELDVNEYYSKEEIIERWGVFPCFYENILNANTNNLDDKEVSIGKFLRQYHGKELPVPRHRLLSGNSDDHPDFLSATYHTNDVYINMAREHIAKLEEAAKTDTEEGNKDAFNEKMNKIKKIIKGVKEWQKRKSAIHAERVAKRLVLGKHLLDFEKKYFPECHGDSRDKEDVKNKIKSNKPQSAKNRNKMFAVILAIAIDKYNYDPEKKSNKATGESRNSIKASLQKIGLDIGKDSLREYLKDAYDVHRSAMTEHRNRQKNSRNREN